MVARWAALYTLALACPIGGLAHAPAELEQWGRNRAKPRYDWERNSTGGRRRLRFVDWRPIRITVHTDELQQDLTNPSDLSYLVDDLLGAAVRWLALALKVAPVMGSLQLEQHCSSTRVDNKCARVSSAFQRCGDSTIPREHFSDLEYCPTGQACRISSGGDGVEDTDFSLYVRAHDDEWCGSGSTLAYASSCYQDENDRPVAGSITFCKTNALGEKHWDMDVATAVHEILHALGFSLNSYAFYRDDEGAPRTARDRWGFPPIRNNVYQADSNTILEVTQSDGSLKHYVTLPRVVEAARNHYDCPTLDKLALEEHGGDGSSTSHWESRYMHTEVMAAVISNVARISPMTLALLEDSGWYRADYSMSGAFQFGKGAGCNFLTEPCVTDGATEWPDIFCTNTDVISCSSSRISGDIGCTHDLLGKAYCDACLHEQTLDTKFQYFDNPRLGGSRAYLGYCPLWLTYSTSSFCSEPILGDMTRRTGEAYGPNSRCISSTGVLPGWSQLARPEGSCRNVQCGFQSVTITFGSHQVVCRASDEGRTVSIGGDWVGDMTCPSYETICGDVDRRHGPGGVTCHFPGVLRDGRCICSPGYIDEDCSIEDRETTRDQYPFGLQYPQEELVLEATMPLSAAQGLIAWPFSPTLVNEAPQLSYSVSPVLPEGLTLSSTTGVLAGTPSTAVDKAAYTFRAAGGSGASTTTVFITVLCQATEPNCEVSPPNDSGDIQPDGGTPGESNRCIGGYLLPAACVDSFTYQGTAYTGCTTIGSQVPWCSHDSVYAGDRSLDGDWSACEVCVTTSETLIPNGDPSSLILVMTTTFSAIQADPGLEPFMEQFASTVFQAIGIDTSVQSMSAMEASTALEFCLPAHCIDVDGAAMAQFRSQLADSTSSLRKSEFGQAYLQDTTLMRMSGTNTQIIWPKPKNDADGDANDDDTPWWDIGFGDDITTLVIGGVLFLFAAMSLFFCLSCFHRWLNKVWLQLQNRRKRQSGHSRRPNPSPQVLGQPSPAPPPWIPAEPSPVPPQVQQPRALSKDECMTRMLEMGFEFSAALAALETNGWNVSRATHFLNATQSGAP